MNCVISSIHYCPVKSISFQNINSCEIKKNLGIDNDRIFAFSRNVDLEKAKLIEKDAKERKLNNFLTLKNSPVLNKYNFIYENNRLILTSNNKECDSTSNSVRGIVAGGSPAQNVIQQFNIATGGNTTDFGDLSGNRYNSQGCGSDTRALFGGGAKGVAKKIPILDLLLDLAFPKPLADGTLTGNMGAVPNLMPIDVNSVSKASIPDFGNLPPIPEPDQSVDTVNDVLDVSLNIPDADKMETLGMMQ